MTLGTPTAETPSKRPDSSGNDTRDRLLESALTHFSEKGYDATSVREIIEDARVTRPVLYYYFENKEDLFCQLVSEQFDETYAQLDEILSRNLDTRERLEALIEMVFERAATSPRIVRLLVRYFVAPPDQSMRLDRDALAQGRFERIVRIMAEGVAHGELRAADPILLAQAFCGMMDLYVMALAANPVEAPAPETGKAFVDLFMNGAANDSEATR